MLFFIPGPLITAFTFPGVIVHELSHQLFCRFFKIPVYEVCYFRFGNPAGYVLHAKPKNWFHNILIGMSPFFLNSFLGALISFPSVLRFFKFEAASSGLDSLLIWLGISIAMHAIPSTGDASSMLECLSDKKISIFSKLFIYPLIGLIYVLSAGSVIWLDLLYAAAVVFALPELLIALLV